MTYFGEMDQKGWEKGRTVPGYRSERWRKDACGAWIARDPAGTYTN